MDDPESRFTRLYDRCCRSVLGYAPLRVEQQPAEDVAGETFLIAWRRLADVPEPPLPWLLGVARNLLRKQYAAGRRGEALVTRLAELARTVEGDVAERVAEREAALAVLAGMPERDVAAVILASWYGLTPRPGQAPRIGEAWYSGRDGLLISDGKRQEFSGITLKWRIGEHEVGLEELRRLPGDAAGLRAWLGAADPLTAAFHLLGSATTARTRAAMYALLAERPDLTPARNATDALGRTGVAVTGPTARPIIDPADARLLSIEYTRATGEPRREGRGVFLPAEAGTVVVYEATGWTGTLDRP